MKKIITHTIKKDEKLENIAKMYNMELKDLITLNDIKERTRLGIGNILKVYEK